MSSAFFLRGLSLMSLIGGHQVLQTVFILAPPRMGWRRVGHSRLLQLGRSSFRSVDALAHLHLSTFHRRKHFPSGTPANSTCFSVRHLKIGLCHFFLPTPCLTLMKNMAFLEVDVASFVVIGSKPGSRVSILLWAGVGDSVFSLYLPAGWICPTLGNRYLIAIKILIICCFK